VACSCGEEAAWSTGTNDALDMTEWDRECCDCGVDVGPFSLPNSALGMTGLGPACAGGKLLETRLGEALGLTLTLGSLKYSDRCGA
jgi:hypothetical protein